jgi:hypothetical protein
MAPATGRHYADRLVSSYFDISDDSGDHARDFLNTRRARQSLERPRQIILKIKSK